MRICKIEQCEKSLWAYGLCSQHGQRFKVYGDPLYTKNEQHGMRASPEYRIWCHMKERCYNPQDKSYFRYGKRGIRVCDSWKKSFVNFYNDMGNRPTPIHQLDRINNNGNYEPSNCRWATPKEQARNTRRNHFFMYDGRSVTIPELAEISGVNYDTLRQRLLRYKWPLEKSLSKIKGNQ